MRAVENAAVTICSVLIRNLLSTVAGIFPLSFSSGRHMREQDLLTDPCLVEQITFHIFIDLGLILPGVCTFSVTYL